MAQSEHDDGVDWYHPKQRAIIPLNRPLYINRSNQRLWRQHTYRITLNQAFRDVMLQCRENRDGCWISNGLIDFYTQLHQQGHALSLECWNDNRLVGGIYGVKLGAAFCGESMFSAQSGAGKIALIALFNMLQQAGYHLFDAQYKNPHLMQFKIEMISGEQYFEQLQQALKMVPQELHISSI